jgi:hypothetical protein
MYFRQASGGVRKNRCFRRCLPARIIAYKSTNRRPRLTHGVIPRKLPFASE